jgi:hypothetical protein
LGKTSLIGYLFNDKRHDFLFTDSNDQSWRNGCADVLFSGQFTIFDVHGQITDIKLLRSIQPYAYVQIVYITDEDLNGEFLQTHAFEYVSGIPTIVIIFDHNYDNNPDSSTQLIKRFEHHFQKWSNVLWTTAPVFRPNKSLVPRKIKQRNKRLRETLSHLLEKIQHNAQSSPFQTCFQIQSSFYSGKIIPTSISWRFATKTFDLYEGPFFSDFSSSKSNSSYTCI